MGYFGIVCEECNQLITRYKWCKECNAKHFQRNFKNWTSGNNDIDKFIQNTQLSANNEDEALEWIPYDRFCSIEYIAKGGFGNVYKAYWKYGLINYWNNKNNNWSRISIFVALKSLNNSKNVTLEFINEITLHHKVNNGLDIIKLYGITQDPVTKDYMMVLDYASQGSLRKYLDSVYKDLSWKDKFSNLWNIADGLSKIHEKELIHRDLHVGNILVNDKHYQHLITDMGLCKPADYNANNASENTQNNIYGVLPYIAPEILRGQNYTKASDIYSFGIIMYEVFSGLPPYFDVSHNENLAIKICKGLRPRFNIKVPQLIVDLIKKCLDANPLNRPTATEIIETIRKWRKEFIDYEKNPKYRFYKLIKQTKEADRINETLPTTTSLGLSYETHTEAIYTSRLLNFNDLPEPKNSDDYYKQNDNLISNKFSESLQIDISQLEINQSNEPKEDSLQIDISQLKI